MKKKMVASKHWPKVNYSHLDIVHNYLVGFAIQKRIWICDINLNFFKNRNYTIILNFYLFFRWQQQCWWQRSLCSRTILVGPKRYCWEGSWIFTLCGICNNYDEWLSNAEICCVSLPGNLCFDTSWIISNVIKLLKKFLRILQNTYMSSIFLRIFIFLKLHWIISIVPKFQSNLPFLGFECMI